MLSVAKLARGREAYYLETVAPGREGAGVLAEPDGRWLGQAASTLGLVGTVDGAQLTALLAGVDPSTGEVLSAYHDRVRVAAYDCTYSTPKSVSLLHALGPEEVRVQVRAGHEEAAAAALGYLERRGARVRRSMARGQAASSLHVLVANLAPGPDGRWSALDARGLFLELGTVRDLYETQLRSELTCRLGVSWRELNGAWADLVGIDPSVKRAFSRRSADIETALEQAGRSGPRAGRIASLKTRPEKDLGTPYEDLVETWRERSYHLGVSDARLAAVAGRPSAVHSESIVVDEVGARREGGWAERALGQHGVTARDGTCRRGDLVRARCVTLPSGAPVEEVELEVEGLLTEGRVVAVPMSTQPFGRLLRGASRRGIPAGVAEPVYTTPAVLGIHDRLTSLVRDHPSTVQLLSYRPGGRLAALDALGGLSRSGAPVVALAPGRAAAASFEAVTGIETTAVSDLALACDWTGDVVVAEAQRMGPWELSSVVEPCIAAGGRVILFAPSAALGARFATAAILAPDLAPFAPGDCSDTSHARGGVAALPERHCFAGREVLLVGDGPMARDALLEAWRRGRESGQRPLLRGERRRGRRLAARQCRGRRRLGRRRRRGSSDGGPALKVACGAGPVWPTCRAGRTAERSRGRRARRMCSCCDRFAAAPGVGTARASSRGRPAALPRFRARGGPLGNLWSGGVARRSDGDRVLSPPVVDRRSRAGGRRSNDIAVAGACCGRGRGGDEARVTQGA